MNKEGQIEALVKPIRNDLTSGAAELALQGIAAYRTLLSDVPADEKPEAVHSVLTAMAKALVKAQPAMAPIFHLANTVLVAADINTASATTGDVRGTITATATSDGTKRLVVFWSPVPANMNSTVGLLGQPQF